MSISAAYTIRPAKYAGRWNNKPQMAVSCPSADGFKSRAARIMGALNARYSGRENAYIVSPAKAAKFERLLAEGWDGNTWSGALIPPAAAKAVA
jgi:hypothetical protein